MRFIVVPFIAALAACAPIQHAQTILQPIGQPLTVGPGDVVVRVTKQRDLANIFGAADIYGRKTDEGYSELRFAGVERDGTIVLFRKDIEIITNETTMSRSPFVSSYGSSTTTTTANVAGTSHGNQFSGTGTSRSNTSGSVVTMVPTSDYHVVVPPETIPIRLPKGTSSLPFEGRSIDLFAATPTSLSYRIN